MLRILVSYLDKSLSPHFSSFSVCMVVNDRKRGQCSLKFTRLVVLVLSFLSLFHAKTRHFVLFTYCCKCILFEIKIIIDYTGTPLGSRGFGWGESIYKHKHFPNWGANVGFAHTHTHTPICSDRILTFRIRSICSPAKGGTGCYRVVNYQPGS